MYPNIILSNRLQPTAIVDDTICTSCLYNDISNDCKRKMEWQWRGDLFPVNKSEYEQIKNQLEKEQFKDEITNKNKTWFELPFNEQHNKIKKRLKNYSRIVYKTIHVQKIEERVDTVCMRENSFYVDTVRAFRDRRYVFKGEVKLWYAKSIDADNAIDKENAINMMVFNDSMQLAHKIILNSF